MSFAHLLLVKRFFYSMLSSDWMEEIVSIDLVGVLSDFPFAFAWNIEYPSMDSKKWIHGY